MVQQVINTGNEPNDGLGDSLRNAYTKTNQNFSELYSRLQSDPPSTATGSVGDTAGMIAVGTDPTDVASFGKFYYCFQNYDGSSEIWRVLTGSSF